MSMKVRLINRKRKHGHQWTGAGRILNVLGTTPTPCNQNGHFNLCLAGRADCTWGDERMQKGNSAPVELTDSHLRHSR